MLSPPKINFVPSSMQASCLVPRLQYYMPRSINSAYNRYIEKLGMDLGMRLTVL